MKTPNKVLVVGAGGVIGRSLLGKLLRNGYSAVGTTQSDAKARTILEQGAVPEVVDVLDAKAVRDVFERVQPEMVIDMLTALPKDYKPVAMRIAAERDREVRLEGGGNVLAAAQTVGVRRYVIQSSAFWYAPGPGAADESVPFAYDATPAIAAGTRLYAELERRVFEAAWTEGIALRYGFFYGPGTWYARDGSMANQVREGSFPIVGNGEGVWPFIHVADAAEATVAALTLGHPGAYNITDDYPSPLAVWLPAFAHWLGAPMPPHISVEKAIETSGPESVYYATRLRAPSNAESKQTLRFRPRPLEWLHREQTTVTSLQASNVTRANV